MTRKLDRMPDKRASSHQNSASARGGPMSYFDVISNIPPCNESLLGSLDELHENSRVNFEEVTKYSANGCLCG